MHTSSSAPSSRLSYDYFRQPPSWIRNLVAVLAGLLAFYGTIAAAVVTVRERTPVPADRLVEAVEKSQATPATTEPPATGPPKFFAADSKFRVAFPGEPERSTEKVEDPPVSLDITMYMVELETAAYMVSTFPFAAGLPFDFDGAAEGTAAGFGGAVDSKQSRTYQGHDAMEVSMSADVGAMRLLMVRAPDRVVQLLFATEDKTAAGYEAFRDSLEIL